MDVVPPVQEGYTQPVGSFKATTHPRSEHRQHQPPAPPQRPRGSVLTEHPAGLGSGAALAAGPRGRPLPWKLPGALPVLSLGR